jgi:hypothetical protein
MSRYRHESADRMAGSGRPCPSFGGAVGFQRLGIASARRGRFGDDELADSCDGEPGSTTSRTGFSAVTPAAGSPSGECRRQRSRQHLASPAATAGPDGCPAGAKQDEGRKRGRCLRPNQPSRHLCPAARTYMLFMSCPAWGSAVSAGFSAGLGEVAALGVLRSLAFTAGAGSAFACSGDLAPDAAMACW